MNFSKQSKVLHLQNKFGGAREEEHVVVDELLVAVVGRERQDLRPLPPPLVLSRHQSSTSVAPASNIIPLFFVTQTKRLRESLNLWPIYSCVYLKDYSIELLQ